MEGGGTRLFIAFRRLHLKGVPRGEQQTSSEREHRRMESSHHSTDCMQTTDVKGAENRWALQRSQRFRGGGECADRLDATRFDRSYEQTIPLLERGDSNRRLRDCAGIEMRKQGAHLGLCRPPPGHPVPQYAKRRRHPKRYARMRHRRSSKNRSHALIRFPFHDCSKARIFSMSKPAVNGD